MTILQAVHLLSLISSDSTLPQLAQVVMIVSAEDDNMVNVVMRDAVRTETEDQSDRTFGCK